MAETKPVSDKSPFWRFSVKFYAVPGVADACIALQDAAGVDVNVLFFLLWQASEGRTLDRAEVAELESRIGPWRDMAVVPLRHIRRALKASPSVMPPEVAETFRNRVKSAELEAERLQQEAMFAMVGSLGRAAAAPAEAAQQSIAAYQALLRPFPAGPLETILGAFAKFEAPR